MLAVEMWWCWCVYGIICHMFTPSRPFLLRCRILSPCQQVQIEGVTYVCCALSLTWALASERVSERVRACCDVWSPQSKNDDAGCSSAPQAGRLEVNML